MKGKSIIAMLVLGFSAAAAQASGPVVVVQAGSPEAADYTALKQMAVKLPYQGKGHLAMDAAGAPKALLLPAGANGSAREQFLKYGAALNPDGSLELPVTAAKGGQVNIVMSADGSVTAQ